MRYIVLDTNCLLQALPSKSPYHKIWTDVFNPLKQIPWPKVEIIKIAEFIKQL